MAAASPAAFAKSDAKLEAAYVVMGSQGAIAPAVYKGATECPSITVDKSSQQMNVRASPQMGKSAAFPVLVCELLLPTGTTAATLGKQKLPLPLSVRSRSSAIPAAASRPTRRVRGTPITKIRLQPDADVVPVIRVRF